MVPVVLISIAVIQTLTESNLGRKWGVSAYNMIQPLRKTS